MPLTRSFSAAVLTGALAAASLVGIAAPAAAAAAPISFGVIGDVPYGSTQTSRFPSLIAQINADPAVELVSHLGDISSPLNCSDAYYATIKSQFDTFSDPLLYTPGDNEWADCSRATTGAGNPLERLAALRSTFFPTPGTTLGANPMSVTAQAGFPENVRFNRSGIDFALLHLVGSDNDLGVWSGYSAATAEQVKEVEDRNAATSALIRSAFAAAKADDSRAVVFITQADMFISGTPNATFLNGFRAVVQTLATESIAFAKPVYLINGDTHAYLSDTPLTTTKWRNAYGVASVPNLTRVTIQGGTDEWTKFSFPTAGSATLGIQRVPFGALPANAPPTAAFTATPSGLRVDVDGSTSRDSDGSVVSYSWDFGEGPLASGVTGSHTYTSAGTKTITLTVTDDDGATGTTSRSVAVSGGSQPPTTLAADAFTRTVSSGLGAADTGGAWTVSSTASAYSVSGGLARLSTPRGATRTAVLNAVAGTDTDIRATVGFPRPTASTIYVGISGRKVGAADYGARVIVGTSGAVQLQVHRENHTTVRSLTVPGLTYSTGDRLNLRLQVTGVSPTTLRAKTWKVGTAEPAAWQIDTTDASAALQRAGTIGLYSYLGQTASPDPATVTFDNLLAAPTQSTPTQPPANLAPTASFTATPDGLTVAVDGTASRDTDGTIASHAWNFGEGDPAAGPTASHTYAAPGTKTISLTVTDDDGATHTATRTVTVPDGSAEEPPPPGAPLAQDSFTRTASNGLGSAEAGGAWTVSSTTSAYSVSGGMARLSTPQGATRTAVLNAVSGTDTEVRATVGFPRPTASTIYVGISGRKVGTQDYGARVIVGTSGAVELQVHRESHTTVRKLTIPGLTYSTGDRLNIRLQVTGTSPTTLRAKTWKAGTAEPADWQIATSDSSAALQRAGTIGLYSYLGQTAAPTPAVVTFDDLWAGPTG